MTVTDEAKLFAIRKQLLEMRYKLDASINIINYVFERDNAPCEESAVPDVDTGSNTLACTLEDGLYPGQLPHLPDFTDVDPEEPNGEEIVECVE